MGIRDRTRSGCTHDRIQVEPVVLGGKVPRQTGTAAAPAALAARGGTDPGRRRCDGADHRRARDRPARAGSRPAAPATPKRSRRGSGAVTLHDVARLAGVAPITASRALKTPAQVSDAVRQRVADAVARTGYVPNLLAGGLASTRSRLVAAVVPTISGQVFLETVQSLTESLAAQGYQDRKSTRLNSSHPSLSRMPSSA
mgnify:CR=1 FL=1